MLNSIVLIFLMMLKNWFFFFLHCIAHVGSHFTGLMKADLGVARLKLAIVTQASSLHTCCSHS
jgi:hypothetical protein